MSKFAKDDVEDLVALTPTQEGILLAYLRDPSSREYFVHSTAGIDGPIDEARFGRAWQALVDRHQALRSTFRWENLSQPVQVVLKSAPLDLTFVDLRGRPGAATEGFREVKALDRERGHDLAGVPFRIVLVRTGEASYQMLLSYHHVILDGWSLGVLAAEFLGIYRALGAGAPDGLAPPTPLRRYVAWHQGLPAEASSEFWRAYFRGYEGGRGLALKRTKGAAECPSAELEQAIDPELDRRIRAFAGAQNVTAATVFYAALAVVLGQYNGSRDVVFGTTVSGRGAPVDGVERMVGNFINTPPLRVRLEGQTVAELCAAVAKSAGARREFDTTSTVAVRRALEIHDDPFDAIMVVENYPLALAAEGMRLGQLRSDEATSYDLTVSVTVHEGLAVQWSYRSGRLGEGDVRRVSQRFERVLRQFVERPDRPLGELDLMLPGERETILERFARGPVTAERPPATFLDGFSSAVRAAPDHPAVVFGDTSWSYTELDARSARLARWLVASGLEPETPVAVVMERSADLVAAVVAVLRAGGAYVPISPGAPPKRLEYLLDDSGARFLLVHDKTAERVAGVAKRGVRALNVSEPLGPDAGARPPAAPSGEQLAYIMYTSGSSGLPKGVMVEHRALMNTIAWFADAYEFDRATRSLLMFDATADTSLEDIFGTLLRGGTLHVASRELLFDRDGFRDYVNREGITFLSYLPGAFRELIPFDRRLPSVKHLVAGSEAVPEDLKDAFVGLGYAFYNGYGTTEAGIESTTQRCSERPVTLGKPNANAGCLVLDPDGRPCPIGVPGELVLLGPGLARGYWKRDELTAQAFVECPVFPGERMYRTGDLALWQDDGEVRFLGRIDAQVKVNGFRVEPHEIEAAILAHEKVKEAAVSANRLANGTVFLSAFVVCATATDLETKNLLGKGLRAFLAERLPEHMIPNRFFALPELPRLGNDKVDLQKLKASLAAADAQDYVAPADEIEERVAAIWGGVLGRDRVTTATAFRELGGDSLMLIRIYSQLNRAYPGVLKVQDLFDHRTVQELAAVIRERTAPPAEPAGMNVLDF